MYLVYEVNHRTHNKVREGTILLSVQRALAIINLVLWFDALLETACRIEPDNEIFFGRDVWVIFRPIFRASIVALRILSALMFFMIGFPRAKSGDDTLSTAATIQSLRHEVSAVWHDHMTEVEAKRRGYSSSPSKMGGTRKTMVRALSEGIVPFGKRRDHHYGVVLHALAADDGNRIKVEPITNKHIASMALGQSLSFPALIIILAPPVVLGWALRLRGNADEPARYVPEFFMNCVVIFCCVVICLPKYALPWSRGYQPVLTRLRDFFSDPELIATTIFGIGAALYYIVTFALYVKHRDNFLVDVWPQLNAFFGAIATVLQLVVIILFHMKDMLWLRKPDHLASLLVFGLLVISSMSLFIMQIEREEFGVDEHHFVHNLHLSWVEPLLGVLIPLAIDFRLHAFLLTYAIYADYAAKPDGAFVGQAGDGKGTSHDSRYDGSADGDVISGGDVGVGGGGFVETAV